MNRECVKKYSNPRMFRMLRVSAAIACLITTLMIFTIAAYASPSISDLHKTSNITISAKSTDGTNTAAILSEMGIYTDRAISDQYKTTDENGNKVETKVSKTIDSAEVTVRETGNNGKAVAESVPTVKEILQNLTDKPGAKLKKELKISIENLYQLTSMRDFKYKETHYRVITDEIVSTGSEKVKLDNGMIEVSFKGTEITKSSNPEDFVVVQVNPENNRIHYLRMKEYDEKTGDYIIAFPCIGPYMLTTIISGE